MTKSATAMNYRCETDTAVVVKKQENDSWEQFKSTVIKTAEQILGHKTIQEERKLWVTEELTADLYQVQQQPSPSQVQVH